VDPIHLTSVHWIITFGSNAGVLATEADNISTVEGRRATADLVCIIPEKAINNAVKDYKGHSKSS